MIEIATAINSLGYPQANDAQPASEEPMFVLTASQLQAVITQAIQSLQDRIESQSGEIAALHSSVASLENEQDTFGENQLFQLQLINQLREAEPAPEKSSLIDELYQHMRVVGLKQTTFAGAARILRRSKGRIKQLHPILAMDQRFIILPSESHKQRLLIRLREV